MYIVYMIVVYIVYIFVVYIDLYIYIYRIKLNVRIFTQVGGGAV